MRPDTFIGSLVTSAIANPVGHVRRVMRASVLASVAGLLALTPAFAAAPVHLQEMITEAGPGVFLECDGFDILESDITIERNRIIWRNANGEDLRERRHVHFGFTLTNSESGLQADYLGHFSLFVDWTTETFILSGALRQVWIDGRTVWSSSGRSFFTEETGDHFTGNRSLIDWESGLCDAMAGASS